MHRTARTAPRLALALALGAVLGGCSSTVKVQSDFPEPQVRTLPVHMGVFLDNALKRYVYNEDLPGQSKWTISLGNANVAMLNRLFGGMFASVTPVNGVPVAKTAATTLDGVIKPSLEKFEFNVPTPGKEGEAAFAEAWVQFKLTLYQPNGKVVTVWPVSGYGKAEILDDKRYAVRRAAVVALRDVGAAIATQFAAQPAISTWLEDQKNARESVAYQQHD